MKIGIITFHFPYNCGAALQCAALHKAVEKMDCQVSVINYRPWYHQNRYTPFKNPFEFAKTRYNQVHNRKWLAWIKGFVRAVGSWRHYGKRKLQHQKFSKFISSCTNQTRVYRSLKQLQNTPPAADLYISGSDQLWNVHITDGTFDEAYFLRFGNQKTRRITFSVGADFTEYKTDPHKALEPLLADLDAVALRENKCEQIVRETRPDLPVSITIDPTFLLENHQYDELMCSETLETEPFIFTYTMPDVSQHKVYNAAHILSEATGLKIIDASGQPTKVNKKIADNRLCGPDEFLWYMRHADYVLTNSFHGTAFSVIMDKQFFAIPHSKTGNRVTELLKKVGLESRWTDTGTGAAKRILQPIDYTQTHRLLEDLRNDSLHYLRTNIEEAAKKSAE